MEDKLVTIKAALAAVFTAISAFLGWKGIMALVWVVLMLLDYLSGSLAARKSGTWKSSVARDGFLHKGGMILVVLVALLGDLALSIALPHIPLINIAWPEILFPMVLAWYIITELGSILENAEKMGARVPGWLLKIFNATLKTVEKVGEELLEKTSDRIASAEDTVAASQDE